MTVDTLQSKPKKKRRLTKKQRGFVKDYIETENGTEAAMRNYNLKSRIVARSVGSETLALPYVRDAIQEALPDELLAKVHMEGLEATRLGRLDAEEWGEIPDHATRHKFLDSAYKIKGKYAPEKSINVNVEAEPSGIIKDLANGLLENQRQGSNGSSGAVPEPVGGTTPDKERAGEAD